MTHGQKKTQKSFILFFTAMVQFIWCCYTIIFCSVCTCMIEKISQAYCKAKFVKVASTLAWMIRLFFISANDWNVRSNMEFISKCFDDATVSSNLLLIQNFWNDSDRKIVPKSACIRSVRRNFVLYFVKLYLYIFESWNNFWCCDPKKTMSFW